MTKASFCYDEHHLDILRNLKNMSGNSSKVMASAFWMIASQWLSRSLGILSTLILARLLMPEDYGVVAIVTLVIGFIETALNTGADTYLIRKPDVTRIHYDTAWTMKLLVYLFIGITLYCSAGYIATFLNDNRLYDVFRIISFAIAFAGFQNIGLIALQKSLEFRIVFYHSFLQKLIGFAVTVYLAYQLRNYWAMLYGMIAIRISDVLLSYILSKYRPRLCLKGFYEQWSFIKWLFIRYNTSYIRIKADQMIISKLMGPGAIGLYNMANELANMPASELIYPITSPIFSGYSKLLDNPERLTAAFISVVSLVSIVILPMSAGFYVLSDQLIPVLLGKNWLGVIPILKLSLGFSVIHLYYGIFCNIITTNVVYIRKLGYLDLLFLIGYIPLIYYIAKTGSLNDILFWRIIAIAALLPILYYFLFKIYKVSLIRILKVIIRPLFSTLTMMLFLIKMDLWLELKNPITIILYKILLGALLYTLTTLITWIIFRKPEGGEKFILDKLRIRF